MQALDLKKRIESLIDREYLERDRSDPNVSTAPLLETSLNRWCSDFCPIQDET